MRRGCKCKNPDNSRVVLTHSRTKERWDYIKCAVCGWMQRDKDAPNAPVYEGPELRL